TRHTAVRDETEAKSTAGSRARVRAGRSSPFFAAQTPVRAVLRALAQHRAPHRARGAENTVASKARRTRAAPSGGWIPCGGVVELVDDERVVFLDRVESLFDLVE